MLSSTAYTTAQTDAQTATQYSDSEGVGSSDADPTPRNLGTNDRRLICDFRSGLEPLGVLRIELCPPNIFTRRQMGSARRIYGCQVMRIGPNHPNRMTKHS